MHVDIQRKTSFEMAASLYDKYRPSYPPDLFKFLIQHCSISKDSRLLEVGCGSGQATQGFQDTLAQIVGIDISASLLSLAQRRFQNNSQISFEQSYLENFISAEKFDLIYAAQSFHWIEPETGYEICKNLLKPNGTLALFWNSCPFIPINLRIRFDEISDKYGVLRNVNSLDSPELGEDIEGRAQHLRKLGLFANVSTHCFEHEVYYSAEEYCGLLRTYSDHILLSPIKLDQLCAEISQTIRNESFFALYKTRLIMCHH